MSKHTLTAVQYGQGRDDNGNKIILSQIKEEFLSVYNADRRVFDLEDKGYVVKLELINPRFRPVAEEYKDREYMRRKTA